MKRKIIWLMACCLCCSVVMAQTVDYRLPARYVDVLIPREYERVLTHTIQYLQTKGTVASVNNGVVDFSIDGEQHQLGLDNVVRKCANQTDRSLWKSVVERHFDKYFLLENDINTLSTEVFDSIKGKLCVRFYPIKDSDSNTHVWQNNMVVRQDLPNVYSVLMLDVAGGFVSIDQEQVNRWQQHSDSLFELARSNMQQHTPRVVYTQWQCPTPYFQFAETNYAAVSVLNLPHFAPQQVGQYGTVFAIPTKGLLMGYAINDTATFKQFIRHVYPAVTYFHADQPGAINTNFYWYYRDSFEQIRLTALPEQDDFVVETPSRLSQLWDK